VTDPWLYPLLVLAGVVAGALNVIAGGGSFLTLPILIFMGLPATVANGTNRVGIFFQNVGAVWGFHRNRLMDWKSILWAALPASLGAVAGTVLALSIGDAAFRKVLAFLMIAVTLWTLWDPLAKKDPSSRAGSVRLPFLAFGFFLTGVYGGFVQAGVGFLVLAATTMAGLDLVRGNAVKVLSILAFTIVSLAIFVSQGKVLWLPGLVLALGTFLGGQLGVRFTVLKGHAWVKRVVTVTIIVFAVKLWVAG
jgi:uncharacterized membrane protein YfcA